MMKRLARATSTFQRCHSASLLIKNSLLSEAQILQMQDLFLTNGFHYIEVQDIYQGRAIIETFVNSLGVYHELACLTAEKIALDPRIQDVYRQLQDVGYFMNHHDLDLEDFFIDRFYYDFMWIEMSPQLKSGNFYNHFVSKIFEFKLDQHIPIFELQFESVR